jgi:2-keto-4-pentenoate hydratase/2-oxohepta-3-ene-1,7-dioic acid hydratase in catechol pathway
MTLLPATVILTGTPEGVGFTRQPPIFLKEGDKITIEIEKIGRLSNPVRKE